MAAQDADDPGVLILSQFAGAVEQMPSALIVNPYDIEEMAAALRTALAMPLADRRARHVDLLAGVMRDDVGHWTQTYLDAMSRLATRRQTDKVD